MEALHIYYEILPSLLSSYAQIEEITCDRCKAKFNRHKNIRKATAYELTCIPVDLGTALMEALHIYYEIVIFVATICTNRRNDICSMYR